MRTRLFHVRFFVWYYTRTMKVEGCLEVKEKVEIGVLSRSVWSGSECPRLCDENQVQAFSKFDMAYAILHEYYFSPHW